MCEKIEKKTNKKVKSCTTPVKDYSFVTFLLITLVLVNNAEELNDELEEPSSLYNSTDNVLELTKANFESKVLNKNYAMLIQFYNNYCSHCHTFASRYIELARELYAWRDVVLVSAINCGVEENNDICRKFEIKVYPNIKYYGPFYQIATDNYGKRIHSQDINFIIKSLAQLIAAENKTRNMMNWPDFRVVQTASVPALFEGLDSIKKYVVLVLEPDNSTVGIETVLNFLRYPNVAVNRITDLELAAKYQMDGSIHKIAIIDRLGSIVSFAPLFETSDSYKETIKSFLNSQHITEIPETKTKNITTKHLQDIPKDTTKITEIIEEVKRNRHYVYQADLEMAIRKSLHNEIPNSFYIKGEKLLALQKFMSVLKRYNPLGSAGRTLISKLAEFVSHHNYELSGEDFEIELKKLEKQLGPIYSATHYVGCFSSQRGLRGFSCSLWQLFHFMTVQAANTDKSQDPLEVLQAMHGYIKYFFGCTGCSEHFQEMATNLKIWNTPSKEEAILWLWTAHNKVNQRLVGDATEDPKFPKIQFPSADSCRQCYKQPESNSTANLDDKWDKMQILQFLKNLHNPENVSRFGLTNDQPTLGILRQSPMISDDFSDLDMYISILLFVFCTVILVVAFNLIAFKGRYRKKSYCRYVFGKVLYC